MIVRRLSLWCSVSAVVLLMAGTAMADSPTYTTPHLDNTAGATSVTFNGNTFVNQGLVGTGRLTTTLHDFNGETLGSFSSLALDLSSWRRNADGSYSGGMFTLPDRGPNGVGGLTTTNYASRLNRLSITLNPYTGSATLAPGTTQLNLTQNGGFLLADTTGVNFTGRDPLAGTVTRGGIVYPSPPTGDLGAGKIAMDAEAVTFLTDGSFYVGDEYGAMIYYFDAAGRQLGAIAPTGAVVPRVSGAINFNGANDSPFVAGSTGRRSNQGMEGLSVSPDGTKLFAVLQSATLQDNYDLNATPSAVRDQERNNTRVIVYDISATRTPTAPIAEYVLQLPTYRNSGNGSAADKTAAQSEVLALNNTQFLVLSRDGNGRGNGSTRPDVFKSILLVDTAGATNIAGTSYSNGVTPIVTGANVTGATLNPAITPVQYTEVVNLLNPVQLGRFGMNITNTPTNQYSLSEKWEAMGLVPVLEEGAPQDFFLLVGNDNDFISSDVDAAGVVNANTALTDAASGTGNNDNVILIYRLTLPTYIDPQALLYLQDSTPFAIVGARRTAQGIGDLSIRSAMQSLDSIRRLNAEIEGIRVWAQGDFDRASTPLGGRSGFDVSGHGLAAGADFAVGKQARIGGSIAYQSYDDRTRGFGLNGDGVSMAIYGAVHSEQGFYGQAAIGMSNGISFDEISRPAAYGLTATGRTQGDVSSYQAEIGWAPQMMDWTVGPFIGVNHASVKLDAYTETGASLGNADVGKTDFERTETNFGLEVSRAFPMARPSLRLAYTSVSESGGKTAVVGLASSTSPGAVQTVALPGTDDNFFSARAGVDMAVSGANLSATVESRYLKSDARDTRIMVGISKAF